MESNWTGLQRSYAINGLEPALEASGRNTSAVIKGRLKGYSDLDYLVRAGTGQTMTVSLQRSNLSNYFNVLPPGSKDVAIYAPQTGEDFKGVLSTDGDYTIRVYLVLAAARRNESSDYTLTITVTAKALVPVPASKDAVIPGTHFHASAKINRYYPK